MGHAAGHPETDVLGRVRAALTTGEAVVAGCLSGTSADGIDVVLARPAPGGGAPPGMLAFATIPFEPALHARLRAVLDVPDGALPLADLAFLSRDLGAAFGGAVRTVAREHGLEVDLVGSHGQTVWHHDGRHAAGAATLQLGEGALVAAAAGATCVNDFRWMDVALGGEGAPLSALVDPELFAGLERPSVVLNLGGMANVTYLGDGQGGLVAFDTGPAGSLLDGLARRLLDRPFDPEGRYAALGRPSAALLERMLAHPFFARTPPKSTGRDTFGEGWLEELLAERAASLRAEDCLATGVELVARSIADALDRFLPLPPRRLVLCGGGLQNRTLAAALERTTGLLPESSAALGVDPDAREALVFALLAARAVLGQPCQGASGATGATTAGGILGSIHLFAAGA